MERCTPEVGGQEAPLHTLLARIRMAASRSSELAWLYSRVLLPAEESAARLWACCRGDKRWRSLLARLSLEAQSLLERVRGDPYEAYEDVRRLAERVRLTEASVSARLASRQALTIGAGVVSATIAAVAPGQPGPLGMAAGIAAMILGVAAALLSKYRLGAALALAAGLAAIPATAGGAPGLHSVLAVAAAVTGLVASMLGVEPPSKLSGQEPPTRVQVAGSPGPGESG